MRPGLRTNPAKTRAFKQGVRAGKSSGLARNGSTLKRKASKPKARAVSPATPSQRAKIRGLLCIVCGSANVTPTHLIDRSIGGGDDPLDVVPCCPGCHRSYDEGGLDLLPFLEPDWREELAQAVRLAGLARAYRRITNEGRSR